MNHKQLFRFSLLSLGISAAGSLLCLWLLPEQLLCFLITSLIWNLVFAGVLFWIEHNIKMLSDQLMHVYSNRNAIDIQQQQEGALSILENDIYKLIRTFYEQRERSAHDRLFLVDTLNDISHQLKTPLTSMQMMGELLAQELPNEKRAEFSAILLRQLERLQWLVTSLLKLSRLDACAITFQKQRVDVRTWVIDALEPIQPLVRSKELHIQIDIAACQVETDPKWSKEALLNILKNAAEHTPQKGTIRIAAQTTPLFLSLSVIDNGEGMDLEEQAHVFERFYRGKHASTDSVGIGMAMAKAILNAQQAEIQVHSAPGKGTCFTILFPISSAS